VNTTSRTRPVDGKSIASVMLAVAAVCTVQYWVVATVLGIAAVAAAIASRRALRADSNLRGYTLSLIGFLIGAGVLLFAIIGPPVLMMILLLISSLTPG